MKTFEDVFKQSELNMLKINNVNIDFSLSNAAKSNTENKVYTYKGVSEDNPPKLNITETTINDIQNNNIEEISYQIQRDARRYSNKYYSDSGVMF